MTSPSMGGGSDPMETPARDALVLRWADAVFVDRLLARPDLVLAALIESGWRPTDDDLRAMGGTPIEMTLADWPIDLGTCAYNRRGKPGADPHGTCSFGCYDEPECQTCRPREGWPSDRGEPPEPWSYAAEPGALDHDEGGDLTVWQFVPKESTDG